MPLKELISWSGGAGAQRVSVKSTGILAHPLLTLTADTSYPTDQHIINRANGILTHPLHDQTSEDRESGVKGSMESVSFLEYPKTIIGKQREES